VLEEIDAKRSKDASPKSVNGGDKVLLLMELMDEGGRRRRIEEGEERSVYERPSSTLERTEGSLGFVDTH
jgi:hypothetical protein